MNSDFETFHIKCDGAHMPETVSNYHPLDRASVHALLEKAKENRTNLEIYHPGTTNSICIRLCQGIEGMTCPNPGGGEVCDRENRLSIKYIDWLNSLCQRCVAEMTNEIFGLMRRPSW